MASNTTNQAIKEFESALSAIIPEIAQLVRQYQVSGALMTICSAGCVWTPQGPKCTQAPPPPPPLEIPDPEMAQQFWADVTSKLSEPLTLLKQAIQKTDESFEVNLLIDIATVNLEQPVVCQWDSSDVLQCSNT